jgi:hypothetical protein
MTIKLGSVLEKFSRVSIVFLVVVICAGNITNSFFLKWGFRDDQRVEVYNAENYLESYSLAGMMQGTAPKPFVYRSAVPRSLKWVAQRLDPDVQAKLYTAIRQNDSLRKTYAHGLPEKHWTPVVAITYHATYMLVVAAIAMLLLTVYKIAQFHGFGFGQSLLFTMAVSLVYPLTFQQGGYFYDFFEQLGVLGACYLVLRRRMLLATLAVFAFAFNKETFFLVPLAFFALTAGQLTLRQRLVWTAVQLAGCVIARYVITSPYAGNPGGTVEIHFMDNLKFWIHPASFLIFYNLIGRGIYTPSVQNPIVLVPAVIFFRAAWKNSPSNYRNYFHAAFWPLLILFALFGYKDEVRNFSLAFPALVLIALHGVRSFDSLFAWSRKGGNAVGAGATALPPYLAGESAKGEVLAAQVVDDQRHDGGDRQRHHRHRRHLAGGEHQQREDQEVDPGAGRADGGVAKQAAQGGTAA